MEETLCPISCIEACEDSWLQKHESFVLTIVASVSTLFGMLFAYLTKSRCTHIRMCGISCRRTPINVSVRSGQNSDNISDGRV